MKCTTFDIARLREVLSYDSLTGVFTWNCDMEWPSAGLSFVKGEVADRERLRDGYNMVVVDRRRYMAHRVAWLFTTGAWPRGVIDHINGVKNDNRFENLRDTTQKVNGQNRREANKNNHAGLLGVYPNRRTGRWRAQIRIAGKARDLGTFATPQLAQAAYLKAKREHHAGCTI